MLFELLDASVSVPSFRAAVRSFAATSAPNERILFPAHAPSVKVERALLKILESYPELPIESVQVDGVSGCEYFRGEAVIRAAGEERRIRFDWDCKWKALELGWTDYFGFPDQTRAAREFGHDCFRVWEDRTVPLPTMPTTTMS